MNIVAIIPARMAASRFPDKPMALIHGMPMIGHCYHRVRLTEGLSKVYVATCDLAISNYIDSIGGAVLMTADSHTRASTRTAEALALIESQEGDKIDVVLMVQGDEPLITPEAISLVLREFLDPVVNIVNLMSRIRDTNSFLDKNNVKVVVDRSGNALYFSREPIPSPWKGFDGLPMYMQTGIIAFRRQALIDFNSENETRLEQIESIDMNRIIENGGKIKMVITEIETLGVDTPSELITAEKMMQHNSLLLSYLHTYS